MSKTVKIRKPRKTVREVLRRDPQPLTLTFEEFEQMKCSHCGGAHLRACPRIKRMSFHGSGTLNEIEFWPDGSWDTTNVLWPENVVNRGESNA